jgi:hypothetical protein
MASFRMITPESESLSDSEKLLVDCIQKLGESHSEKIGKSARLKSDPKWCVKITGVRMTDFGLPIMDVSAISYEGKPIDTVPLKMKSALMVPSSCWEGELDFDV